MSGTLNDLLARYGYLAIALFLFIESIGIPIPGETALITAAALAGGGKLSIGGVIAAALFGTVLGGMSGYWIGARGGQAIVLRFGRVLRIDDARMNRARAFFEEHGASALLVGRFIAVVRSFLGIFAGVANMPPRRFALYNALGALVWSLTFSAIGYFFGRNLPRLIRDLGRLSLVLALVLALVIGLFLTWRWFTSNRARIVTTMEMRWDRIDAKPWMVRLQTTHPRLAQLIGYQFVRGEYLAIHLAIGWALSLAALGVFGAITEDVVEGAPLTRADVILSHRLGALAGPTLLGWLRVIGGIGGPATIAVVAVIVVLILAMRRNWLWVGGWISAYGGALALDIALRRIVVRGELPLSPDLVEQHLVSLPTGRTVVAITILGLIAHLLIREARSPWRRVGVVVTALLLLGGGVTAQLFLGTAYLSTESASIAAGVIWLATAISGLELARYRRRV